MASFINDPVPEHKSTKISLEEIFKSLIIK